MLNSVGKEIAIYRQIVFLIFLLNGVSSHFKRQSAKTVPHQEVPSITWMYFFTSS